MTTLGEKLESFYLALSTIQINYNDDHCIQLADTLYELEHHEVNVDFEESLALLQDVLKDIRKKSSQILRAPYIETINQLITSSRKRLKTKTSLESEITIQHGQRYVHILIELLGNWSNMIMKIMSYGFSKEIIQLLLLPLHARVIEMAKECFLTFKQDKDLENWCVKLMQSSFSSSSTLTSSSSNPNETGGGGGGKVDNYEINLTTLDNFAVQLSTMRNIINQHYLFLFHTFSPFFIEPEEAVADADADEDEVKPKNQDLAAPVAAGTTTSDEPQAKKSSQVPSFLEQLLIVTKEELLQWKDIDMMYITLETAYLQQSIIEACLEMSLLSLEEKNIFILQCMEDAIFLFHKIMERAKQTNEEKCLFMISNKILELLQFILIEPQGGSGKDGISNTALFANILQNKQLFYYCSQKHKIVYTRVMKKVLSKYTGKDYLRDGDHEEEERLVHNPIVKNPPSSKDGKTSDKETFQTPSKPNSGNVSAPNLASTVSSLMESNSSLKQAASFFFSGNESDKSVNQWIGWASPLLQNDTPPTSNKGGEKITAKSPAKAAPTTVEQILLQALDLTDDETSKGEGKSLLTQSSDDHADYSSSAYHYDHSNQPFFNHLIENDLMVYFNCLSVMIRALISLRVYLSEHGLSVLSVDQIVRQDTTSSQNTNTVGNVPTKSSIWLLMKEYWKCQQSYEHYLLKEIQQYIHQKYFIFERKQQEQLLLFQSEDFGSLLDFNSNSSHTTHASSSSQPLRHRKVYFLKEYLERSYDITGQEMEERVTEQYLKQYYRLFLQQFPFSPSYFILPPEKHGSQGRGGVIGQDDHSIVQKLPSFLVNPLTSFFSTSTSTNKSDHHHYPVEDSHHSTAKQGNLLSSSSSSFLSENNYIVIISEVMIYILQHILHQLLWGDGAKGGGVRGGGKKAVPPPINEWGGLLLHEDILALQRYYEQCVAPYLPTEYEQSSKEEQSHHASLKKPLESKDSPSPDHSKEFQSMNDRNRYYIQKTKKCFAKIMNLLIVLTLDHPVDIKRYPHLLQSTTSANTSSAFLPGETSEIQGSSRTSQPLSNGSSSSSSTEKAFAPIVIHSNEQYHFLKRSQDVFTANEIKYLLNRRTDFSKDLIDKLDL